MRVAVPLDLETEAWRSTDSEYRRFESGTEKVPYDVFAYLRRKHGDMMAAEEHIAKLSGYVDKYGVQDPFGGLAKQLLEILRANPAAADTPQMAATLKRAVELGDQYLSAPNNGGTKVAARELQGLAQEAITDAESTDFYGQNETLIRDYLTERSAAGDANTQWVDENVTPRLAALDNASAVAHFADTSALASLDRARKESEAELDGIAKDARRSAQDYNRRSDETWTRYSGAMGGLDSADRAAESRYISETDPLMSLLQARGYVGDVASQGARATADPEAVAAQKEGIGFLRDDLLSGDKDQREVMGEFKKLSDPQTTAKERLMYELTRRQFEAEDRGNREAQSAALAAKGLRSGAASIAANQAARSQLAQDRMLGELGMLASSQERADRNRAQWADQANQLRASGQAARGMYSDATSALRGQTFDEAHARGTSADDVAMSNQAEKGLAQRFQDEYAAQERDRVGKLAGERQQVSADTNKQIGDRYSDVYDANVDMLDSNYGREEDARGYEWDASTQGYDMDKDVSDTTMDVFDKYYDRTLSGIDAAGSVGQTRAGVRTQAMDDKERVLSMLLGNRSAGRGEKVVRNG